MTKISATVVADSINPQGDRITSMLVTFPRFILAELNTHRMLSKNSASSRAIPFKKMVEAVQNNPFIPIAWQKEHKGMQGSEYFTEQDKALIVDGHYPDALREIERIWLADRDERVIKAKRLHKLGVTKQLCNRLLEPFMWHTVLITATEWENFFSLRCPQYYYNEECKNKRSRKEVINYCSKFLTTEQLEDLKSQSDLWWLNINKGQAEIHMMALAEAMWDAMNKSTPKQLQAGEWHIPFEDRFKDNLWSFIESTNLEATDYSKYATKIATAMAARVSYTIVGDEKEFTYEQQIALHDRMANAVPFHASPFEHCARAMTEVEYTSAYSTGLSRKGLKGKDAYGWCRNFKGFIQYRELLENK